MGKKGCLLAHVSPFDDAAYKTHEQEPGGSQLAVVNEIFKLLANVFGGTDIPDVNKCKVKVTEWCARELQLIRLCVHFAASCGIIFAFAIAIAGTETHFHWART